MTFKKSLKPVYYFIFSYFLLWIILFEFLLPVNNILPKPSVVIESFSSLWSEYNLLLNYLSTISVIYISLAASYLTLKLFSSYLLKNSFISHFANSLEWFSEFVPGIIIGLLLIFWFPESEFIEFIFAFAAAFASLMIKLQNESENVKEEYILAAISLGLKENIISGLKWKNIQPKLFEHLLNLHFYLWLIILPFEFIKGGFGLGVVFRLALDYKDLSALFSAFIITGITVFAGNIFIKLLRNKFIFWKLNG